MDQRFNNASSVIRQVFRYGTGDHPLASGHLTSLFAKVKLPNEPTMEVIEKLKPPAKKSSK